MPWIQTDFIYIHTNNNPRKINVNICGDFFTIISVYLKVLPHFSVIELLDVCDKTSAFYEAYLKSFFL